MKLTTTFLERCVNSASHTWESIPTNQKTLNRMYKYRKRKHNELLI